MILLLPLMVFMFLAGAILFIHGLRSWNQCINEDYKRIEIERAMFRQRMFIREVVNRNE